MRYPVFIFLFLLLSFAGTAQPSSGWSLYLNKTKLLSASVDSVVSIQLSKKEKGKIKFDFSHRDKTFKRSLMVMNEQRNELLHKEVRLLCGIVSFSADSLLAKTSGKPFTVYVVDIPADPAKAMLVRMAPVAICKVEWKE